MNKKNIYQDVAKLHMDSIKTGFLPSLGFNFMTLMYRCIDEADFTTLETDYLDDKLRGFVSGTNGSKSLYKEMLKHPIALFLALLPSLLNFEKIKKIINLFNHFSGKKRAKHPKPELLTICVNKRYQRKGIANNLYKRLKNYFVKEKIRCFTIVVGESLEANKFYLEQGASIRDSIQVHSGKNSNIFIQEV